MSHLALAVEGLSVTFPAPRRRLQAVDAVSFDLHQSETIGVVGESGCGKSVTGLSLMGLLSAGRATGHAVLRRRDDSNVDLLALPPSAWPAFRGNEIGIIFQEPMTSLNPLRSIGYQVSEPLIIHQNLHRGEAMDRAAELLAQVGIADVAQRMRLSARTIRRHAPARDDRDGALVQACRADRR